MVADGSFCTIWPAGSTHQFWYPLFPEEDSVTLTAVNDSAAPVHLSINAEALACDGRVRDLVD